MITVVKLGGSLLAAERLSACLAAATGIAGRIIIVSGGGSFADLIRHQQRLLGFDDIAAHRMAILSMQQTALLCHSLQPALALAESVDALKAIAESAIWLPDWRELDADGVPASWDITSDSLAAWLAGKVKADRLILVKAGRVATDADLAALQRQDLLDQAFLDFAEPSRYQISVLNHQQFLSFTCSS